MERKTLFSSTKTLVTFEDYKEAAILKALNGKRDDAYKCLMKLTKEQLDKYKASKEKNKLINLFDDAGIILEDDKLRSTYKRYFFTMVASLAILSDKKYDYRAKDELPKERKKQIKEFYEKEKLRFDRQCIPSGLELKECIRRALKMTAPKKADLGHVCENLTLEHLIYYYVSGDMTELCFDFGYTDDSKRGLVKKFLENLAAVSGIYNFIRTPEVRKLYPDVRQKKLAEEE